MGNSEFSVPEKLIRVSSVNYEFFHFESSACKITIKILISGARIVRFTMATVNKQKSHHTIDHKTEILGNKLTELLSNQDFCRLLLLKTTTWTGWMKTIIFDWNMPIYFCYHSTQLLFFPYTGCLWICTYISTYRWGVYLCLGSQLVWAVGNRQQE